MPGIATEVQESAGRRNNLRDVALSLIYKVAGSRSIEPDMATSPSMGEEYICRQFSAEEMTVFIEYHWTRQQIANAVLHAIGVIRRLRLAGTPAERADTTARYQKAEKALAKRGQQIAIEIGKLQDELTELKSDYEGTRAEVTTTDEALAAMRKFLPQHLREADQGVIDAALASYMK